MKKSLLIFILFCLTFNAFTQSIYVKAGLNISNFNYFGQQRDNNQKFKFGFQLGANCEFQINTNLFFETGLFFETKGNINESSWNHDPNINNKLELFFIEIPLQIKMKVPVNKIILNGAMGPTLGYGVMCYESIKGSLFYPDTTQFDCFSESGFYSRFYGGLLFTVGIEYKRTTMGVQYNLGLSPLFKNNNAQYASHQSFTLTVGYKLWSK